MYRVDAGRIAEVWRTAFHVQLRERIRQRGRAVGVAAFGVRQFSS